MRISWLTGHSPLALRLLGMLLLAGSAHAQNRDHPGLVPLGPGDGSGEWGTPQQAGESGLVEVHGRWMSAKLSRKVAKWDRKDAKGLAWEDAYKVKTKYYRVKTNVPRYVWELEIKPFLDALGDSYTEIFQRDFGLKGKAVKNKDLILYGSFEDYSAQTADADGPRPRTNPGFIVNGAVLNVFYEEDDPGSFYATVFHEGAHQFFLSLLPGASLPIWLDEALATWFEGATYSRVTGKITTGAVPNARLLSAKRLLRQNRGGPEELFMKVPQSEFGADKYALAWSFLHYLLRRPGEKNVERFGAFLRKMNGSGNKPIAEVFEKVTGENLELVSVGWRGHVEALQAQEKLWWALLNVGFPREGEAPLDLRTGDALWSLDGIEIYSGKQFNQLWRARDPEQPHTFLVIRGEPRVFSAFAVRRKHTIVIPAGTMTRILAQTDITRNSALRD